MKAKFKIDGTTTVTQHAALAQFFTALAIGGGAHVVSDPFSAPIDSAELDEPEVTTLTPGAGEKPEVNADGSAAPKRRRRTKAELEAEAVAQGEAAAQASNEAEIAKLNAGNDQPAGTPTATAETAASPSEPDSYETTSPAAGSKNFTEVEVQDLASRVARAVGPEVVKAEIVALGAGRIADLSQEQRNTLGTVLTSKLP